MNEDDLRNLVDSMPQRIKAIYDAGGGHVKYSGLSNQRVHVISQSHSCN